MIHCRLVLCCLIPLLALTGCASSSPDMMGSSRRDVTIEGIRFTVYHDLNRAEVVRRGGYMTMLQRDRVPALIYRAAEQASGCASIPGSLTTRLPGDTGVGRVDLAC